MKLSLTVLTVSCFTAVTALAGTYSFQTINNPGDPHFNQLLGINNEGTIAGYFGDGMGGVPNNGYTWTKAGGFVAENFPGSTMTQVVAINNVGVSPPVGPTMYNTAGFYVDSKGVNHGFTNTLGTFATVDNPATTSMPAFNQLLALNDHNQAVGIYQDSLGNFHGYEVNLVTTAFTAINLPASFNAKSVMAAGINNGGWISGNYTDTAGVTHGFVDEGGTFKSFDDPNGNGTNTSFFGLNNTGLVVGSFVDKNGTNGLVYNLVTNTWQTVNDRNQSFTAAFTFSGTTINGVNDAGDLVGFYSDGTNVNGMLATPTPEPASLGFMLFGGLLLVGASLRKRIRA
jgi:hypothetical protein